MGDAAGVAYSEEALYVADLPARSVDMIALPVPGTDTPVLTGRGPLVVVCLISATGLVIGSIIGTGVAWLQRARGRLPHLSGTAGKAV